MNFQKEKFSGIDGRTYVRWTEDTNSVPNPFNVLISPSGILLRGTLSEEIGDMEALQNFAEVISAAWQEHLKLKPKLIADIPKGFKP